MMPNRNKMKLKFFLISIFSICLFSCNKETNGHVEGNWVSQIDNTVQKIKITNDSIIWTTETAKELDSCSEIRKGIIFKFDNNEYNVHFKILETRCTGGNEDETKRISELGYIYLENNENMKLYINQNIIKFKKE